jgi:hypothetical protein
VSDEERQLLEALKSGREYVPATSPYAKIAAVLTLIELARRATASSDGTNVAPKVL